MSTNAPMMSPQHSGLPRGELLGRYRSYEDAQKIVDHLAAAEDFDIKTLSIVGNDLRTVEHIRSRLSYPRVAGAGAAQGAMFGAFIGLLIVLFSPEAGIPDLLMAVLLGMAIWMIVGVISYAIRRGRRDFASSSQLVATTFDVVCDFSVAHRARQLVAGAGVRGVTAADDPTSQPLAPMPPSSGAAAPSADGQRAGSDPVGASAGPAGDGSGPPRDGADSEVQPRTGYQDLPDGRPRFGVRVTDQSSGDQSSGDQVRGDELSGDEPSGDEPGETQASETQAVPPESGPRATSRHASESARPGTSSADSGAVRDAARPPHDDRGD
ncbi:YflT domain-containing protein [Nesterenkonia suensis]